MNRIVHVDNSEFFRKLMKTFLLEMGYETESFAVGEEAVATVKAGRVDYAITGMELADMTGEDFIKKLVGSSFSVPVIVVTSKNFPEQHKRLRALGVKAIIQKSSDWKVELGHQLTELHK